MPNFFVRKGRKKLRRELNIYLFNYSDYVRYVVHKRIHLREHWDDMEQFIVLELIKLYPKKYKYTDFDWVVRSAIRRKAIDFDAKIKRSYKHLTFEHEKSNTLMLPYGGRAISSGDSTDNTDNLNYMRNRAYAKWQNSGYRNKVIEFIEDIFYRITDGKLKEEFTDWDREYIDVLIFLFKLGYQEFDKLDILECMGYDKAETLQFGSKLNSFRTKLKKFFELKVDLIL